MGARLMRRDPGETDVIPHEQVGCLLIKWLAENKGSAGGSRPRNVPNLRGSHLNRFQEIQGLLYRALHDSFCRPRCLTRFGSQVWTLKLAKRSFFVFCVETCWAGTGAPVGGECLAKPAGTILLTKGRAGCFLVLKGKTRLRDPGDFYL